MSLVLLYVKTICYYTLKLGQSFGFVLFYQRGTQGTYPIRKLSCELQLSGPGP